MLDIAEAFGGPIEIVDGYAGPRGRRQTTLAKARDELGWNADGRRAGLHRRVDGVLIAGRSFQARLLVGTPKPARSDYLSRFDFEPLHLFRVLIPDMHRTSWRLAAALSLSAIAACRPEFQLKNFTTNEALYTASLHEYQQQHWDNAILGFEKLTTDLSAARYAAAAVVLVSGVVARAPGRAPARRAELSAGSSRSFPEDSLADDAALEPRESYRALWRKPQLDPQYGETALASYNTLIGLYPTSPLIPQAQKEIAELEDWFAMKDYDAGDVLLPRGSATTAA